ncbi:hypothetical protein ACRAWF_31115 [Streptomyces sp. L7]
MPADRHRVLVLDVNETLEKPHAAAHAFRGGRRPGHLLPTWFDGVLRDGFALTAAGTYADFTSVAHDGLRALLSGLGDGEAAARHILDGFSHLDVHPDVPGGVRKLSDAGHRLTAMTNGSVGLTERLLDKAGVLDRFEILSDVRGPRPLAAGPGVDPTAQRLPPYDRENRPCCLGRRRPPLGAFSG